MESRQGPGSVSTAQRRVRRGAGALFGAALLAALLPGAAAADRVTRFDDHSVNAWCEGPIDGGNAFAYANTSTEFESGASVDVFLDPAVPFEEPATYTGVTSSVNSVEGASLVVTADLPITGADESDLGTGTLTFSLTPSGPVEPFTEPSFKGNHKSMTEGTHQSFAGTGTFTVGAVSIALPECFGDVTDISVHENNPRSFISSSTFFQMDCFWEDGDSFAAMFGSQDDFGTFVDAVIVTPDAEIFGTGQWTGMFGLTGIDATVTLTDANEATYTATGMASFTPEGTPVTSLLRSSNTRSKVTEQLFAVTGLATFPGGQSFPMDTEHCRTVDASSRTISQTTSGPKPGGKAPANDLPGGAIRVKAGYKSVTTNRGAALDAEVGITTCPEGERDDFGRTLWYTVAGTGGPVTIDTAGSQVDTVIGVFTKDGADFTEVGCIDDVFTAPLGTTYQAAITIDTETGITYYVEVGGYRESGPFGERPPDYGQIRIAVR